MSFPSQVIESPFGRIEVWATSGESIGARTSGNVNVPQPAEAPDAAIVVNKVPMTFRVDLKKTPYKTRTVEVGDGWLLEAQNGIMLSKLRAEADGTFSTLWPSTVSFAAHEKVQAVLVPFIVEWLRTEAGQALLAAAAQTKLLKRAEEITKKLAEMEAEIEALRIERHTIAKALAATTV